ncbi:hypothetical protein [Paraburkholderia sp. J7]|uniref:hypothetical protein n=1 Tax=Paraburkholderia sp. J7 TaxID=2805438 RepID=UPI002AB73F1E|nr:hypothetical protein [Paraburkholderia sp. J7]
MTKDHLFRSLSASIGQSTVEPGSPTIGSSDIEASFHVMRRLQASRFFIAGKPAEPVFTLDSAVSEWLFASGFWNQINNSLGTMFDQFEEDEVEPAVLVQIASDLDCRIRALEIQGAEEVRFVCGWSSSGDSHAVKVRRTSLISQLAMLRSLLASAAANGEVLEFNL